MTDIHTHILPGIDDGANNTEISIKMLDTQQNQGVDNIVLTPHFYRRRENPESFFKRRSEAFNQLSEALDKENRDFPNLYLGAELAMAPNISLWDELPLFCIEGTENLLLEMPFTPWNKETLRQIYGIINRGITPIFAHLERYISDQRPEFIEEIFSMGMPVQVSSTPILHFAKRKTVKNFIKNGWAHIMASDCHNMDSRLPNLPQGLDMVKKLYGEETARIMDENDQSILPQIQ